MIRDDFYGNDNKWFIAVVKDINDPLNSNRVKVRIKGIHSEDPEGDGGTGEGTTPATGGGGSTKQMGASPETGASSGSTLGMIEPDTSNAPKPGQYSSKISKHWTLGQVTIGATVSGHYIQNYTQEINQDVINNLQKLATNILDPLKEQFPGITVTSGFRPKSHDPSGNHRTGKAADVQAMNMSRKGIDQIHAWIQQNLNGRYGKLINEGNHVHVQIK